ncbi:MAG: hypothetical protein Q7S27_00755 [Nanoarchaeota archaeon]|nr:hypothetical protein [Nanoarchaeota archaeon]
MKDFINNYSYYILGVQMAINYEIAGQGGLVPAFGILMAITLTLSYQVFYKKILNKESEIKDKIRKDVLSEVKKFKISGLSNEKSFSDKIGNVVRFGEILNESKNVYQNQMIPSAILLIVNGIIFIIWPYQQNVLFMAGAILLGWHLISWNSLRIKFRQLNEFLDGKEPKDILGE